MLPPVMGVVLPEPLQAMSPGVFNQKVVFNGFQSPVRVDGVSPFRERRNDSNSLVLWHFTMNLFQRQIALNFNKTLNMTPSSSADHSNPA